MKQLISVLKYTFFRDEFDLRIKIFHLLAGGGVLICISTAIISLIQGMFLNAMINAAAFVLSFILLLYSAKGGKQEICYIITIICVFLVMFPYLFFYGGGYKSGMISFFVFAVVYTTYMLSGWKLIAFTGFELIFYTGLCLYAYNYPEKIKMFSSEKDVLLDIIVGFIVTGVTLSFTMYMQFQLYQKQKKELEQAFIDAQAANRAKSNFLANMSHEIRTPIHVILSLNELVCLETSDKKIKAYGEKIGDAGEMLRCLVDNILDMSKIEAGKTEVGISPYRTADLLRVLELVGQSRCRSKGLQFRIIKHVFRLF